MHPVFIFSVLEAENENAAAWNGVQAAKKSLAASCSFSYFYSRLWILVAFILAHCRLFSPEIWEKCPSLILR